MTVARAASGAVAVAAAAASLRALAARPPAVACGGWVVEGWGRVEGRGWSLAGQAVGMGGLCSWWARVAAAAGMHSTPVHDVCRCHALQLPTGKQQKGL